MEFQFLKKIHSLTNSAASNDLFLYLKTLVYETEDQKQIERKEQALRYLFAGLDCLQDKKWKQAKDFIQEAISIFQQEKDSLREGFSFYFLGEYFREKEEFDDAAQSYQTSFTLLSACNHRMAYAVEKKLLEMSHRSHSV